jgi:hypothetical protein
MLALMIAVEHCDLESVKRLVTEGAEVKEIREGYTAFLQAACRGHGIPIMHWLLTEGGSSSAEQTKRVVAGR